MPILFAKHGSALDKSFASHPASLDLFRIIFINDKAKNEGNWVKTELNVLSGCPITVRRSQGKIQLAGEIESFEIPPNVPCLGNFSCRRGNISSLSSQIRGAKRVDRRVLLHTATQIVATVTTSVA